MFKFGCLSGKPNITEPVIENNHGSGKVVISKESEQILVQFGSRIPSQTKLG
jgi:hypothetical protein